MLEEAIMEAKAGGAGLAPPRESFSPQITVDAPIMIPEEYVPDLDLRMGLYRRMRSEERRVGKECVSTGRSRWSSNHETNKNTSDTITAENKVLRNSTCNEHEC